MSNAMNRRPNTGMLMSGIVSCTSVALIAWLLVPRFESVFALFGTELPWITRAMLSTYRLWWGVPVLIAILAVGARQSRWGSSVVGVSGLLLAGMMFAWALIGCYVPILLLGQTV
jgi:hypothetical protein